MPILSQFPRKTFLKIPIYLFFELDGNMLKFAGDIILKKK